MKPLSPHIVDARRRIAAEEKAAHTAPLAVQGGCSWSARKIDGRWGIGAVVRDKLYFHPVSAAEFDAANSRYRQQALT